MGQIYEYSEKTDTRDHDQESKMKIRTAKINKNTVVKMGDPIRMRVEFEKTMRALEIGKVSGLFLVPRVIDFDASKGILVLERLRNITKIGTVLISGHEGRLLVDTIAASLAVIHDELHLPDDMHVSLPEELAFPGNDVILHGDFSVNNIFSTTERPGIVILDWQMTSMHGGNATYGTRYFDVVWFVNNLFSLLCRLNLAHRHARHASPTARRFINTYFRATNTTEDCEMVITYMKRFFEYKLEQRKQENDWKSKALQILVGPYIQRFVNNPNLAQQLKE